MTSEMTPRAPAVAQPAPAPGPAPVPSRRCDPRTDPLWADLAEREGSLFHAPSWMRVLADAYRLRPQALLVSQSGSFDVAGGAEVGGIAWVEVADLRGRRLVSLPFSDLAGPIGSVSPSDLAPLHEGAGADRRPLVTRLRLEAPEAPDRGAVGEVDRSRLQAELGLAESDRLAWHWNRLEPLVAAADVGTDADPQWTGLAAGARQNIRRSRRSGVRLEVRADLGAVEEYHRLHRRLRREKYRLLAQPRSFFVALHRHFGPDRLRVVLARLDDDPQAEAVAGVVLLRHGDHAYYKLNASSPSGWTARANDAVMWEALVQARRWGCAWFDFGVSDIDQPGLIRYKRKYATGEGEVVVLRRPGAGPSWTGRRLDRILPVLTRAATAPSCPNAVGRQADRLLYRWFC